jgi:HPt (histidine-containing phosphotransfer) domain-containing protein
MIDWQRVTDLRNEIGEDDFFEVVEVFLEEVDETIERLRDCPDPTLFEEDMHFLKGSALNLGFTALSRICAAYEHSAAKGKADEVKPREVIAIYQSSRNELLTSFQSLAAA